METDSNHATDSQNTATTGGLWYNNPVLVQLLGFCPLLAMSNSFVTALALGLATLAVMTGSSVVVSLIRRAIPLAVRLPVFVLIIATFASCVELLLSAFRHDLYLALGIFIPLIASNCIILSRAELFASKQNLGASALDGFMMGIGFMAVLVLLGTIRELLGTGGLFANMQLIFGDVALQWHAHLIPAYKGFLLATLPPGAFLLVGLLLAGKNLLDARIAARAEPQT
ncbi:MAG TPA: electron transport complex subunit E, partial [Dongiaceae bacterium]|nr:electron transport complex subunit E [Dongiaceae bacterium]